jgi:hypothetical protein
VKRFIVVLLASVTALVAGCHKRHHHKSNPIADIKESAKDKDLQGISFTSDCWVKPMDMLASGLMTKGDAAVKAEQVAYRFEGATVLRKTSYFLSANCSGDPVFSFEELGEFKIDKAHKSNDGGQNIDLQFKSLKGLPTAPQGVTAANSVKLCGITNWVQGEEKDVLPQSADLTCYGIKVPRQVLDIYRVDDGNLFLGVSAPPTERPSKLDRSKVFASKR